MDFKRNALKTIIELGKHIGNTPLVKLNNEKNNIYAKLEYKNLTGSIKDRAVNNILYKAIADCNVFENTKIIESSSGNFAISLAKHCNALGLKAQVVVDLNTNKSTNSKLLSQGIELIIIDEEDENGGYLQNRIRKVEEIVANDPNVFWTNQYENINNCNGYFQLAQEISKDIQQLDYVFIAVSTCGTINGLSKYLKAKFPNIKVVGVDIEGSIIFNQMAKKRYIPGIGSSRQPYFSLDEVDDFIIVRHDEIIESCKMLLTKHGLFVGGSSGASYHAAVKYLNQIENRTASNSLILLPDSGDSYKDTIFNNDWSYLIKEKI